MSLFKKAVLLTISLMLVLAAYNPAAAQGIYVDHVDGLNAEGIIDPGSQLTFHMRVTGDATSHLMLNNGFVLKGDDIEWGSVSVEFNPAYPWDTWFDFIKVANVWSTGSGEDTVGIGLLSLFGSGLPAGFDDVAFSITIGPVTSATAPVLTLDSTWYPPSNPWMWDIVGENVAWGGPYVYQYCCPLCGLPYFTSEPVTETTVGQPYTYDVDAGGFPTPTYSLTDAPAGMTVDSVTGLIQWVPTVPGEYTVCVEAFVDCWSGPMTEVQCYSLVVLPANVYTYCTPQPTILKETGTILYVHIVSEDPANVDFESIRVQGKIPPYDGVTVENGEIITTAFIMRFLGSSGFRPITGSFEATYTVDYNYLDGTAAPQLVGDFALLYNPGDVTFDGECGLDDVVFMADYFWRDGGVCSFGEYEIAEFMDIDGNGDINPLDLRQLIELAGYR